jgi:hypothetical protein
MDNDTKEHISVILNINNNDEWSVYDSMDCYHIIKINDRHRKRKNSIDLSLDGCIVDIRTNTTIRNLRIRDIETSEISIGDSLTINKNIFNSSYRTVYGVEGKWIRAFKLNNKTIYATEHYFNDKYNKIFAVNSIHIEEGSCSYYLLCEKHEIIGSRWTLTNDYILYHYMTIKLNKDEIIKQDKYKEMKPWLPFDYKTVYSLPTIKHKDIDNYVFPKGYQNIIGLGEFIILIKDFELYRVYSSTFKNRLSFGCQEPDVYKSYTNILTDIVKNKKSLPKVETYTKVPLSFSKIITNHDNSKKTYSQWLKKINDFIMINTKPSLQEIVQSFQIRYIHDKNDIIRLIYLKYKNDKSSEINDIYNNDIFELVYSKIILDISSSVEKYNDKTIKSIIKSRVYELDASEIYKLTSST